MMRSIVLAGCVLLCAATVAAQERILAQPGARLRLTIASGHQRMSGQFVRLLADSLEFRWFDSKDDAMQQTIPLAHIARIEISARREKPLLKTSLQGAAMGAAFGVVAGRVAGLPGCENKAGCLTRGEASRYYGVRLGVVGAVIGLVRAASGFDVWRPATVTGWPP